MFFQKDKDSLPGLLLGFTDGGSLEHRVLRLMDRRRPWARRGQWIAAACCALVLAMASVGISTAQQSGSGKAVQFDAATIKPGVSKQPGVEAASTMGNLRAPGGHYQMSNTPLKRWVEMGLSVNDYALKAPAWLDTVRFDLEARLPNVPLDQNSGAQMMKDLLIKRFGLKWHEEMQTVPGFELVPDKKVLIQPSGLLERLKPSNTTSGPTIIGGTNLPMSEIANMLAKILGKPVVDSTHLSGVYTFKAQWRSMDEPTPERRQYDKQYGVDTDNLPLTVSSALQQQLGLRLQPIKTPGRIVVVDAMNRQPTGN